MMSLPAILQNAANVVKMAGALTYNPTNEEVSVLKHAAKTVNADDILAVLQEVANFFQWSNNIQILNIGSAPDLKNKKFAFQVMLSHPQGPRILTIPLEIPVAESFIKQLNETLTALTITSGKLILDAGSA